MTPNESIVEALIAKVDDFPNMKRVINSQYISGSASVYLPNTIKNLDNELSHNNDLVHECYKFIDMIKFLSVIYHGDAEFFVSAMMEGLLHTRTIKNMSQVVASTEIDDYVYTEGDDTTTFFTNNVTLFSLYIYTLIDDLYGK